MVLRFDVLPFDLDQGCQGLLSVPPFVGPEQPPSAEIVSDNQHPDQGEEDGDEGEVVGHTRQHQANPLIRTPFFDSGGSAPLSFRRGVGGEVLYVARGWGLSAWQ